MDQMRLWGICQLAKSATPDPRVGTDANEVFFRTDEAHYKADVRLVREARGIILDLLEEITALETANRLLHGAIDERQDQTAHSVYCATVRQVTRLEDDNARLEWLAGVNGFIDG